jgi:prophage antirepressor-like protein
MQMQIFNHTEFGELGVLMIGGKPFFPATEYAKALGYNQPEHAIKRHCKGCTFHTLLTAGGNQQKKFIPEGDLYRLIIRSKLPEAAKFEKFVFDERLPSIRKHGAYITDETLQKMQADSDYTAELLKKLDDERKQKEALHNYVEKIAPKARYYDAVLQCPDGVQISVIAKDYDMSAIKFNKLLHALGVQHKVGKTWLLYAVHANKGYTVSKTICPGSESVTILTCFTQKGRLWIYELLKAHGLLPLSERQTAES